MHILAYEFITNLSFLSLTRYIPISFYICDDGPSLALNLTISLSHIKSVKVDKKIEEEVKGSRINTPIVSRSQRKHT
jgi:hypothetical protein